MLFVIKKLAYGMKCCAVAKHVRLANGTANADLKLVRANGAMQAGKVRSWLLHLPLAAVMDLAADHTKEG